MEQRQLRLGDILDDYCPRERRVTNHAVVAMVGSDVKQTRCTTCDADHEYKHAKVPRQRKKTDTPAALFAQVAAGAPKRVVPEVVVEKEMKEKEATPPPVEEPARLSPEIAGQSPATDEDSVESEHESEGDTERADEEGPVHRPLIRASLPRSENQPPPARPLPEFTIRQPGGRTNRFRPRHQQRGGPGFPSDRSNGNNAGGSGGSFRGGGGMGRGQGGRPPHSPHSPQGASPQHGRRHDHGRKRSK